MAVPKEKMEKLRDKLNTLADKVSRHKGAKALCNQILGYKKRVESNYQLKKFKPEKAEVKIKQFASKVRSFLADEDSAAA